MKNEQWGTACERRLVDPGTRPLKRDGRECLAASETSGVQFPDRRGDSDRRERAVREGVGADVAQPRPPKIDHRQEPAERERVIPNELECHRQLDCTKSCPIECAQLNLPQL
jgi:hypothetical protein